MINICKAFLRLLLVSWPFFSHIEALSLTLRCYEFAQLDATEMQQLDYDKEASTSCEVAYPQQKSVTSADSSNASAAKQIQEDPPPIPLTRLTFDALKYLLILPKNATYVTSATPLFRTKPSDSPDLLDLPKHLLSEGGMKLILKHDANHDIPTTCASSNTINLTVQNMTLLAASQNSSLGICKYVEEKDLGIFLLLDENYLNKQLECML